MSEDTKKPEVAVADSEVSSTGMSTDQPSMDHLLHENKKYRTRAQESEAKIAELEKKFTSIEETRLKEKEDFKTLYEKASSDNESLSTTAKKWEAYESNRRETLLESVPEDERERLSKLDLDTLEYVTDKINNQKTNAPEVVGKGRSVEPPKNIDWSNRDELKKDWGDIVQGYKKQANSKQVKI